MNTKSTIKAYNASDVAKYFIQLASQKVVGDNGEREGITNLKLQKILYLAQAYFLAKKNKPLFKDKIEAWQYGPVVPNVYRAYSKNGSDPILTYETETSISAEDQIVLKEIWDTFGGYSAGRLVDITHSHAPWKNAYAGASSEITHKALKDYYKPLLTRK